jgi:endonuclease YncB( thermonuclease family)
VAAFWAALLALPICADDADSSAPASDDAAEDSDETKTLLKRLTITMAGEVVDERTFSIRDTSTSKGGRKEIHVRLGNVGAVPKGSLDDGEYAEKVKVAKEALGKVVDKQMIWYKAAPAEHQAPNETDAPNVVLADVWSIDGKHVNTHMKKEGHLAEASHYELDIGKDILTAAAEEEKKDSYKKLEEALKESQEAKKAAARAARAKAEEEEAEATEGMGLPGYLGIGTLVLITVGALTNFGRPSNKKVNLNRKKGPLERFWSKLKGA